MKRWTLYIPYALLIVTIAIVVLANLPSRQAPRSDLPSGRDAAGRLVDVVCKMEVNVNWGLHADYEGHTYHFCNKRCRERFEQNPGRFLARRCTVCEGMLSGTTAYPATYLGQTYELCSEEHRHAFKQDPAAYFMHQMWGIPSWLYYTCIALVLIVSFGVFDWLSRPGPAGPKRHPAHSRSTVIAAHQIQGEGERLFGSNPAMRQSGGSVALPIVADQTAHTEADSSIQPRDRFDLFSIPWIHAAARSRLLRFLLQAACAAGFLLIIAAGLFGNQNPAMNIAPILTWTVWWGLLIVLILFAGKAWCYVCPWDAMAGWAERLTLWRKAREGLSLGYRWPRIIRNISLATFLFIGLTWVELGFGVTMKPRITAYLAIAMLFMAVISALLFDRKSFCRYGCLVGRVSGLYAMFSSVEVRARSQARCTECHTKECVKGSESAYGCPTYLYPGKMETNTYCIQCMECVQACPHDNIAFNLRPWGSDLAAEGKPRTDEAYLALLMLSITGFHGLTMTQQWQRCTDLLSGSMGLGHMLGFTLGMGLLMLGPVLLYAGLVAWSHRWARSARETPIAYKTYFVRYAYALLPIALFYHIAHNFEHLLMEGPKVLAMMSDPFGWGWNLFGTARWSIPPLISLEMLWVLQVLLVLVGHVYSLWVAQKTALRLFGSSRAALRSQIPMLIGMIAFSVFSLWLLKQPMEMRTSAM